MARLIRPSPVCPVHGKPTQRSACKLCNAAYMREYMWRRRQSRPDRELISRAKKRAADRGLAFDIGSAKLIIPPFCPVLGIPLINGGKRSENSPSLDRIDPSKGYVPGNVRVISDKANRLKGIRTLEQLQDAANRATGTHRKDLLLIAQYIEREQLLANVLRKAHQSQPGHPAWREVARFLEKVCSGGHIVDDDEELKPARGTETLSELQVFILRLVAPK